MEHALLGVLLSSVIAQVVGHVPDKHAGDECEIAGVWHKNPCGTSALECLKSVCHCRQCAQLNNDESYWERCKVCLEATSSCNSTTPKTGNYSRCNTGQECECVSHCKKELVEGVDDEIVLGAKAALVVGVILGFATIFAIGWKYCARRRERQRHGIPRNHHSTASMSSIQRTVLAKLRNRPPPYDDEEHIKQEKPPSYEESLASPMPECIISSLYTIATCGPGNIGECSKETSVIPDNSCSSYVIEVSALQPQHMAELDVRSHCLANKVCKIWKNRALRSRSYTLTVETLVQTSQDKQLPETFIQPENTTSQNMEIKTDDTSIKDENKIDIRCLKFGVDVKEGGT